MYRTNTPTYNTKNSRIQNFMDFDKKSEKEELLDVKRSFTKNDGEVYDLPNEFKYKYNKVTHKMDDLDKKLVDDKLDSLEEMSESYSANKLKSIIDILLKYDSRSKMCFDDRGFCVEGNFENISKEDLKSLKRKGCDVDKKIVVIEHFV